MPIPEEFITELQSRSDIVDIISSYVTLKKSGKEYMGLCPFHAEDTPSFHVSQEKGLFHCFGCKESGNVITFVRKIQNLSYIDAVKYLADRAGMTLPEEKEYDGTSKLRKRIYEANREAARFYHTQLYTHEGEKALGYLQNRALSQKTITHFGLGYSPNDRFSLVNFLQKKGFQKEELLAANLANETRNGYLMDRFTDRVMFPIIDLRGNVIAFGGRIMSDLKPKYLNTSDTLAFDKGKNLYSLQFAKNKANGQLILVEGYMDVIALHQAGFENTIAALGTALTSYQATIIRNYCEEVVLCYDSDTAGQKATERAIQLFRNTGIRIKILRVPNGKDPDEFIKYYGEQGSARFRILLENSGNDMSYHLEQLRAQYHIDNIEERVRFITQAAKLIAASNNAAERYIYISELSQELNIRRDQMQSQVDNYIRKNIRQEAKTQMHIIREEIQEKNNKINPEKSRNIKAANAEEAILSILMNHSDVAETFCRQISPSLFLTDFNRNLYQLFCDRIQNGKLIDSVHLESEFSKEEMSYITRIEKKFEKSAMTNAFEAAEEYLEILRREGEKLTPQQIAETDTNILQEQLRKMKEYKK